MAAIQRSPAADALPLLQSGDRLARSEFERRYEAMPDLKKAELIEGVVYVGSPVSSDHGTADADLLTWLRVYAAAHHGFQVSSNATLRLDADNEYQPDALLRRIDGRTHLSDRGFIEGSPELVVEIAVSSASIDAHTKLNVYRRSGVQEYILWRVRDRALDWFSLQDGEYVPLAADVEGVIESKVFPGLRLPVSDLLAGRYEAVLAAIR